MKQKKEEMKQVLYNMSEDVRSLLGKGGTNE